MCKTCGLVLRGAARQSTAQTEAGPGQAVWICMTTEQHMEAVESATRVQTAWKHGDLKPG